MPLRVYPNPSPSIRLGFKGLVIKTREGNQRGRIERVARSGSRRLERESAGVSCLEKVTFGQLEVSPRQAFTTRSAYCGDMSKFPI